MLCVHVSQDKRQNFSIGNISGTNGVLCLTFDDRHFDSWTNAIPMFRKYNAKVTFYPHGNLSKEVQYLPLSFISCRILDKSLNLPVSSQSNY